MSNDPFDQGGQPPGPEGERLTPQTERDLVRGRVQGPAIALIVVGVLNLLGGCYLLFNAIITTTTPPEDLVRIQTELFRRFGMEPPGGAQDPQQLKTMSLAIDWPLTALCLVGSVLTILAGIGLMGLRWYGLGVTAGVIACIPCISCVGCIGVGQGLGIWALVVLLNEEVRRTFALQRMVD